ncbi:YlxR family protein [Mollicutes bacterium LVI A0078]|nr:YlxR family protein [Mollicutes bacterium LVI A0075]WOO90750.1 YlxR family protein [Mollicutes bacterium LVI A0078]
MNKTVFRMCVHTRKIFPRNELVRIVVSLDEVVLDNTYNTQGRSIYIQNNKEVIDSFLKRKKLPLRLEIEKQEQVRKILGEYANGQ